MKIKRALEDVIYRQLKNGNKGVVVYGARQVGKTTLMNEIVARLGLKTLVLNGDRRGNWWEALISRDFSRLEALIAGYQALFVDEAQRIPEIGVNLKIILDNFPDVKVMVTGSSALDLASRVSEALTGRVYSYKLFTVSTHELSKQMTNFEVEQQIEQRLIFGSYPEVLGLRGFSEKKEYVSNLVDNYLYKDILEFGDIRNSNKVRDLLKLLAFQTGSQVSIAELAESLELSRDTVNRYIDLLEKCFVVYRLGGYSRNLRNEVKKMNKYYFCDLGVRNALISNFNLLDNRDDVGNLWENFLVMERLKRQHYVKDLVSNYFWRLSTGAEIDWVEEGDGELRGYEFKYGKKTVKAPKTWLDTYKNARFETVNTNNWQTFLQ